MQLARFVFPSWLKKIGWVGFLFFMTKGLVWLVTGAVALKLMD